MILTMEDLHVIKEQYPAQKIVLTSGTFDLFHVGHLHYLQAVKTYGDVVVVMLSGDERVKSRKGSRRPIIPESERAEVLDALKVVDFVFIDPGNNYGRVIEALQPNLYVTDGHDVRFDGVLEESNRIIVGRSQPGVYDSTSALIKYISNL